MAENSENGMADPAGLLTVQQVADLLEISEGTVRAWTKRGMFPSVVLGSRTRRWRRADVERLVDDSVMVSWWPTTKNGGFKGTRRQRRRGRVFGDVFDDDLEADERDDD